MLVWEHDLRMTAIIPECQLPVADFIPYHERFI